MANELTLLDIIRILKARAWLIVSLVIISGIVSYIYSTIFIDPNYTSKGMLYVHNSKAGEESLNINDISASQKLANTYGIILKSDTFLDAVSKHTNIGLSVEKLKKMINITAVNNTEIIQISVSSANPEHARIIAETVLSNANSAIIGVVKGGSVEIVDNASLPTVPSSPNIKTNTSVGILLGIVIGVLISFLLEMFDTRVRDEEELLAKYNLPVLGVIPNLITDR
ncbi:MAG: Wzz/FepE/Etk N-terminal domain-containing protein [Bacillota bacterium]|nr:Wzz/FepE/Etk N-terminal domain-containing protein [Bacillota bacterium]